MRLTFRSSLTLAAAGAWFVLWCLALAREVQVSVAPATISIAALVALLLSLVAAARNVARAWRGPRTAVRFRVVFADEGGGIESRSVNRRWR